LKAAARLDNRLSFALNHSKEQLEVNLSEFNKEATEIENFIRTKDNLEKAIQN